MKVFNQGERVYLSNGEAAIFEGVFGERFVVRPCLAEPDDDEGEFSDEEFLGEPRIVDRIHREAPIEICATEIAELDKQIEQKRGELAELENKIRAATRGQDEARRRIAHHLNIERLDEWLAGKSLWFACEQYGSVHVVERDHCGAALYLKSDYHSVTKPTWVFEYKNSSYRSAIAWPTKEEATAQAREMLLACIADKDKVRYIENILESAKRLGVSLDPMYEARLKAEQGKRAADEVAKAQKLLAEALAKQAALTQ